MHEVGLEAHDRRRDVVVERAQVLLVARARGQRHVDVVSRCSPGPAGARVERPLVQRDEEDGVVVPEDVLRSVPVVDVEVHDRDALGAGRLCWRAAIATLLNRQKPIAKPWARGGRAAARARTPLASRPRSQCRRRAVRLRTRLGERACPDRASVGPIDRAMCVEVPRAVQRRIPPPSRPAVLTPSPRTARARQARRAPGAPGGARSDGVREPPDGSRTSHCAPPRSAVATSRQPRARRRARLPPSSRAARPGAPAAAPRRPSSRCAGRGAARRPEREAPGLEHRLERAVLREQLRGALLRPDAACAREACPRDRRAAR